MDYFQYNYACPYISGTDAKIVRCDGGCKLVFPTLAVCRNFVRSNCASNEGWKNCNIAKTLQGYYEFKFDLMKSIRQMKLTTV